jgi:ectoine hydroxylase-related dioxygenase (phytanoyl-CoA dioxygenase family)
MITKYPLRQKPSTDEADFFRKYGYIYVENFYDYQTEIRPILKDIFQLIGMISEQNGISIAPRRFDRENFDQGLPCLIRDHRPVVSTLYDAVKKLPNYVRLAASAKHDVYARSLLGSDFVGFANRGYGIRMDNPGEDQYATQLHQDYVSQLCSQNSVVLWSPLRDVAADMGPVVFYPGSHSAGVFPILKVAGGSQGLVIDGAEKLASQFPRLNPEVFTGDCILMHSLLLHESGRNRSARTRWSMISRYFDFTDATGRSINWKGGLQEGYSFEAVHPELTRGEAA